MPRLHVSIRKRQYLRELIVNNVDIGLPICHPVGDVPTSIDASGPYAFTSIDAFCQHAIVDNCYSVENVKDVDDCHSAGDILTSVDTSAQACIKPSDPADDVVKSIDGIVPLHLKLLSMDITIS